jgi:hypothetical protein
MRFFLSVAGAAIVMIASTGGALILLASFLR